MNRPFIDKWAEDLLKIAQDNWDNLVLLEKLLTELKHRSSHAGCRARQIVLSRVNELVEPEESAFVWPTTDAPAGTRGFAGENYWYEDGLLSYVGYRVGKSKGVRESIRRRILDCVIFNEVPKVNSPQYMQEWGPKKTSKRLKKLAESIASFTRNAKRRNLRSNRYAIEDWEADLLYLEKEYYHPKLGFKWPKADL